MYGSVQKSRNDPDQVEVVTIFKNFVDHNVKDFFPAGTSIWDPPNYRYEVDLMLLRCDSPKFAITKTEFWDASNRLVRIVFSDPAVSVKYNDFAPISPFAAMQEIFCQKGYAGVGLRLAEDKGSITVKEVFEGSPAAKAGVSVGDIIFRIDNEPVSGLALKQIVEKLRGPEGTKVLIKLLKKDSDPIEVPISREIVKLKSVESAPK